MGMKRHNNDELLRTICRHKKKKQRGQRALHSQYDIQNYISFLIKKHLWHLFNNQENVNNFTEVEFLLN